MVKVNISSLVSPEKGDREQEAYTVKRFFLSVVLLLLVSGLACGAGHRRYSVKDGNLGPCLIRIAVPAKWNGNLLIIAHGLRTVDWPLSAEFSTTDAFPGKLLNKGWLIASTSYRRNGWIVDDAIADIGELLAHVESTYGKPKHIYIVGSSMGGMIVTKLAETANGRFDGILAIGAALWWDASDPHEKLNCSPRIPLLFLSNRNELDGPRTYLARLAKDAMPAALWHVQRDGHCNVTDDECLAAFRALIRYHDTGKVDIEKDATIVPKPPRSVAVFMDGKAFAKATSAQRNVETPFVASDLARLGIVKGAHFIVRCGDKSAEVLLGTAYFDVPQGEWVAFMTAEGFLRIARNWASAAEMLGCKANDTISIERASTVK
jgi:pimeloyl-ACP methyl ester carboxylesterase